VLIDTPRNTQSSNQWNYDGNSLLSRAAHLRGFAPAIGAFGTAVLIHIICFKLFGASFTGIFFVYLAAMIAAAWCGYLPGMLIVLAATIGLPFLLRPDFSFKTINPGNVIAAVVVSAVISRAAEERRRAESAFHNINAEVDRRVRERTGELETEVAELRASNRELKRTNRDLDQFAQSASHDLQEPVRTVFISTQMLREVVGTTADPVVDHYINQIVRSTGKLERLLKDLRSYLTVTDGAEDPEAEADAERVLKRVAANLKTQMEEHQVRLRSTPLPRVRMREAHLEQILQNLIGNAVKYRGESVPQIQVSAAQEPGGWLFSVKDNGIGIDPEYSEHIFGIFRRLHGPTYEGTGIGLALCQRIVERYGGRIWVESAAGQGSTFFFTVPKTI
jgi:signal transduction histidine kinase